ncbi:type IV pilus biogenesis protein PilM [Paenibacillus sp. OSY-SE]|uniref:type IV pilus biogenesis protein PilM n=1 Tax=Paenibacillus sp. OSY-SE TaxID=1196323 RepID=UPI0002DACB8A|nr:pilus assembly protein PilM [Paenibacillus sp. OSY-SE]
MKLRRNSNRRVGLEINDTWLQAAEIIEQPSEIQVVQAKRMPLSAGIVEEGRVIHPELLTAAILELWEEAGFQSREVIFGIPSAFVLIRHYQLPSVVKSELKKMIDMELELRTRLPFADPIYDIVSYPQSPIERKKEDDELELDPVLAVGNAYDEAAAAVVTERRMTTLWSRLRSGLRRPSHRDQPHVELTVRSDVLLVAVPKSEMIRYRDAMEAAKLVPRVFDIKPLALHRLLQRLPQVDDARTYVTASIHAMHTDIFLFHRGQLRLTRSLSINISASISMSGSRVSYLSGTMKNETEIYESVCDELAMELERLIDFYRYSSQQESESIQFVFICGDTDGLKAIYSVLERKLDMPVRMMEETDALTTELDDPLYPFAVPVSLACRGGGV